MKFSSPSAFFTDDHRRCDELWAELESAVDGGVGSLELWQTFDSAMRRHFAMEEEVLFPVLEEVTGMHGPGPTMVMRNEHAQMRSLLDQMGGAAKTGEFQSVLDHGDTLMMLIQQHNVKEEGMLYPLADQALEPQWAELEKKLASYAP